MLQSESESKLAKMFSDMHELKMVDNEVFLDRDGETFNTLINFLRCNREKLPELDGAKAKTYFDQELEYWEIAKEVKIKLFDNHGKLMDEDMLN